MRDWPLEMLQERVEQTDINTSTPGNNSIKDLFYENVFITFEDVGYAFF